MRLKKAIIHFKQLGTRNKLYKKSIHFFLVSLFAMNIFRILFWSYYDVYTVVSWLKSFVQHITKGFYLVGIVLYTTAMMLQKFECVDHCTVTYS